MGTEALHVAGYWSELASEYQSEEWVLHEVTHRLTPFMADLDVAVKEDVGVRAADKLKHLYPEHGTWAPTVLQHTQSLFAGQNWTAGERKAEIWEAR